MADEEQLVILRRGAEAWNAWRDEHPGISPDLSQANLIGADLSGADLREADLREADLREANLRWANLNEANLGKADLGKADLREANLHMANLRWADLREANLLGVTLYRNDLRGANLDRVRLLETSFADLDLSACRGLDSCDHAGPSVIDHRTLQRSGPLPLAFLRGVGLPDRLIEYLPSILEQAIQMYSCFISYSSKDEAFAQRLHADLQAKGVRCWFAPEDMKIGDKIRTRIDEVIRLHEKLLLILSENSVASSWVEKEVETAFERETETKGTVLFPVRLDETVMAQKAGWAADIKRTRHIGDFRRWKEHDAYQKALDRLLRDLRGEKIWELVKTVYGN